jgi:hypothetical protein
MTGEESCAACGKSDGRLKMCTECKISFPLKCGLPGQPSGSSWERMQAIGRQVSHWQNERPRWWCQMPRMRLIGPRGRVPLVHSSLSDTVIERSVLVCLAFVHQECGLTFVGNRWLGITELKTLTFPNKTFEREAFDAITHGSQPIEEQERGELWKLFYWHCPRLKIFIYKPWIDRTERIYVECFNPDSHEHYYVVWSPSFVDSKRAYIKLNLKNVFLFFSCFQRRLRLSSGESTWIQVLFILMHIPPWSLFIWTSVTWYWVVRSCKPLLLRNGVD